MKNVILAEPSTIALFGMGFVVLLFLMALVGAVGFLIVHFSRKSRKPAPPSASPAASSTQIIPRKCPQCGAELKPDVSEGLCPACLLQRGIATEGGAPPGTPPFVPPTIPDLARLFPQLEILELIGKGGMGAVYKARQPALDRFVALKILSPHSGGDLDFAGRFTREARALAKLSHPNIVGVYDFGQTQTDSGRAELPLGQDAPQRVPTIDLHYFIMEYVDGPNLRQVEQAGKLSPREALEIIPQICAALQFAHDEGIVHRDIKPENVLLDKKGRVKIADFGLAKILGQEADACRLTGARDVVGTPHYMAPEQVEKPQAVDHRADIYSLGVVFYEMLTGELPLGKFQPPSSCGRGMRIDVRLDEVVLHALEKEPSRRYQQASQVKTAVETIATTTAPNGSPAERDESAPSGNQSQLTPAATRSPLRRGALTGFIVFLVIVVLAIGVTLIIPRSYVGVAQVQLADDKVEHIQTECVEIQSSDCLRKVVSDLKLAERWNKKYGVPTNNEDVIVELLRRRIDVYPMRNTSLASVGVYDESAGEAAKIANKIAETYCTLHGGRVSDRAIQQLRPVKPNIPLNLFIGVLVGLALGIFTGIAVGLVSLWRRRQASLPSAQKPDHFWRGFAMAVLALISIPIVIPIVIAILGILAAIAIPNFVKVRNQALAHRQEQAIAIRSSGMVSNSAFGPVIERVINLAGARTNYLICFQTGNLRTPPSETAGSSQAIYDWARHEGVDAGAGIINKDVLSGFDMAVIAAPAQCWEELSPAQAARRLNLEPSGSFKVMSYGNASALPDTCVFRTREGGIGILQVTEYLSNPPGLKVRYKFLDKLPAAMQRELGGIAAEWSPVLFPGEKPDLQKILDEAKKLTSTGHFEEALQHYLWHHNHAQEFGDAWQNAVRLTSALSDWEELGRRYPKAKQALMEIRDSRTQQLAAGQGYSEMLHEVQAINHELLDDDATVALIKTIHAKDPKLTEQNYFWMEDLLLQKGEYDLLLDCMGDPQAHFESARRGFEMQIQSQQRMEEMRKQHPVPAPRFPGSAFTPPDMGQLATNNFIGEVHKLIEILVGADRKTDAEKIRDRAVAILDDARLKSAVSDAEEKIQKRAAPDSQPQTRDAVSAAQKWLALIDGGNYSETWKEASAIFRGAVTEPGWENSMTTFRQPLGDLLSRKLKSAQLMTELPGAPDGQYVVMQFETSFAGKKSTIETVTFMLGKDGQWKSAGYFIK